MGERPSVVVVGGGIVGLATACALAQRAPPVAVHLVEKEREIARHQSGHNSGVIHSGIYYRPGSLKARFCTAGRERLIRFCDDHRIPYRRLGKVIVATDPREVPALQELRRRGVANGVPGVRELAPHELKEIEPEVTAVAALHVPGTGIVEYRTICAALLDELRSAGGEVTLDAPVEGIVADARSIHLATPRGVVSGDLLVNCAGLYADRLAARAGSPMPARIVPFRGEYFLLRPESAGLVRGLVYPVPDPEMPFLGVHFTRTMIDTVEAGPNAVLAWAREGYRRATVRPRDVAEMLVYSGFARMARRYWRTAMDEMWRSLSRDVFAASLRKMVPAISVDDLRPGGSGVRAQAIAPDGVPVDDFLFTESPRALHVLNCPSPAATASLAIGEHIAARAASRLGAT